MIINLEKNTIWTDGRGQKFQVLDVVDVEGKTWVHYINRDTEHSKEYSCYAESFVSRFIPLPN
jgi:hypothetical protein